MSDNTPPADDGRTPSFDDNPFRSPITTTHSPFVQRESRVETQPDPDPIEEFWASFAMITHTGERFTISVCFRNRKHYNTEMRKFESAKNIHIVLKDINEESVVIKRDMLLHILPEGVEEQPEGKKRW